MTTTAQPATPPRSLLRFRPSREALITLALILLSLLVAGLPRVLSPEFRRPFEQDELVTLGSTSAGMYGSVTELQARPKHSLGETFRGFVRPFAGRWDPNYHIIHSWAVTVSTFFTGFSELMVRLPAFFAFLGALAVVQWLVWSLSRSRVLMLLAGAAFAALPYTWQYSTSARGYSVMLLIVACQLALLRPELWRRVGSSWLFTALSLLNILCFLNMASTLVMWIAPICLAIFLLPQPRPREVATGPNLALLRQRWLIDYRAQWCQTAALGLVSCLIFVLCKMHNFMDAQARYGLSAHSRADALVQLAKAVQWLFPGATVATLALALVCAGALLAARKWTSAGLWIFGISLAFCALYSLGTHKVAWERTYGFLIPPVFLLVAEGWALAGGWSRTQRLAAQGVLALGLAASVAGGVTRIMAEERSGPSLDLAYSILAQDFAAKYKSGAVAKDPAPFILKPYSWNVDAYLPMDPTLHKLKLTDGAPATFIFELERGPEGVTQLRTMTWSEDSSKEVYLPAAELGGLEPLVEHPYRSMAQKKLTAHALVLQPTSAGSTSPAIGIALTAGEHFDREILGDWLSAVEPADYATARVTLQNYQEDPSLVVCWVTREWPLTRWQAALKSLPAAQKPEALYLLEPR